MTTRLGCGIATFWGPRREGFDNVLSRYLSMMDRIYKIDPTFHCWFRKHGGSVLCVDHQNRQSFRQIILQSKKEHEDLGYHTHFRTHPGVNEPKSFALSVYVAGLDFNAASLTMEGDKSIDTSLSTFRIFRGGLLALAESFDAERAYAYSYALSELWTPTPSNKPGFPIAWISYVARRASHLVTPPTSALVERRPNGALLMAATDETFDVDNPDHMALARDIEAAVAPLHGHPWLPEDTND